MAKMKAYASFDDYLEDQSLRNQVIIRALRRFVERVTPGLVEAVKWGNGCWVGANATVMADVGHDAIVGAGSVVTRPVPPFAIVAGNPARVLRMRGGAPSS